MAEKEVGRIFVGGLSWETTERTLERTFGRFGKVIETQVVVERDTGRSRGFGFVTFAEPRAVDTAIEEMHNGELDGRTISVNKAQPRMSSDDGYGYGGNAYSSGARGGYRSAADTVPSARDDCFKCGRPGHWARECPYSGGGRGSRFSPSSRYGGGSRGRGDRFGGSANRYVDDRYDGGRYLDRDLLDSRDGWYGGGRDRYTSDRYLPTAGRFSGDRYGAADRYPQSGYGRERSYERDGGRTSGGYYRDDPRGSGGFDRDGPRIGGSDKYGSGGPARFGGNYRDRPGPYDRPSRGGRPYDDRY